MNFRLIISIAIIYLFNSALIAQKFRYSIPGLDTLEQSFIVSGAAASVLRQGQGEIILTNSLISYWIAFHQNGKIHLFWTGSVTHCS